MLSEGVAVLELREEFLSREGQEVISDYISKNYIFIKNKQKLPVILYEDNNSTIAAIAFTQSEFEKIVRYNNKPKKFYIVPIEKLAVVSSVKAYLAEYKEEEWRERHN